MLDSASTARHVLHRVWIACSERAVLEQIDLCKCVPGSSINLGFVGSDLKSVTVPKLIGLW